MQTLWFGKCCHTYKNRVNAKWCKARQIAMYLAKKHTDFSTAKIGTLIGNKDHATVLHACKTIKQLKEVDKSFRAEIEEIQTALKKV